MLPDGIDDPARPSGGNTYDRRVCRRAGRGRLGGARARRARRLAAPRRGVAPRSPRRRGGSPTAPSCCSTGWSRRPRRRCWCRRPSRLRLVVLVHMPLGDGPTTSAERASARCSRPPRVVTTSEWTRRRLMRLYALPADRVHVAEPGVDAADLAPGTADGGALLCVAAVTPRKGHDVLVDALADARGPGVALRVRGQPRPRPGVRRRLAPARRAAGWATGCASPGPRIGAELDRSYAARRPAGAALARRDLRHGRHRGAGPRPAGGRRRRRRRAGGPRSGAGRRPAGAAGAARRPGRAGRCAAGLAGRRRAARGGCARPRASGGRRCRAGRRRRRSSPDVLAGAAP